MRIKTNIIVLLILLSCSCAEKSAEEQVIEWVSENAIQISTVEPGNGFEDLLPIGEMIGDARIVSLGEPTHGNKEVFQLKHRMIEYLVEEMGFNIFALECPFGEAYDINRYVVDGIGDPEKALAGIYYWTWDTKEVLELLKWMRAYNSNPENIPKLKFFGFDTQDPERAANVMLEYLEKVDTKLAKDAHQELGILAVPFSNPELIGRRQYIPEEYDSKSLIMVRNVMKAFDSNKEHYIDQAGLLNWKLAKQHAHQVELFIEASSNDGENWGMVRDLGQAQNLKWIMNQEGSEAKMIIWAHNAHVNNAQEYGHDMMGVHLRKLYGDQLKIFGFFFNQGEFKALDEGGASKGMHNFTLGPAPEGFLENSMAHVALSTAVLDLQQLPSTGPVYQWFNTPQQIRYSWGGYDVNEPQKYFWNYTLAEAFDALVFLDSTTAVEHLYDSDFDDIWLVNQQLSVPLNTGFEDNNSGEAPDNWVTWSKFQRLGVEMIVSDENPYSGNHSAMLKREKGLKYGEFAPNIRQYIDAKPYRGKKITLRVASRAELTESNFAFLRMSIDPDPLNDAHEGLPPLYDNLDSCRIDSKDWKIYEVEAQVDERAEIINYGIYLRDFGSVWMDDVTIEIIE